tara:strand:- start:62357 stop:64345 length:1989 start_codon:yes stop_codon:yes gene_type:complete
VFKKVSQDKLDRFKSEQMDRILELPLVFPVSPEIHTQFSDATLLKTAKFKELLETQSNAIIAYMLANGLFAYIGVGFGKTLISISTANAAYSKGLRKILLLVPPSVSTQLIKDDIPKLRKEVGINMPVNIISGATRAKRRTESMKRSGLYIMSYSQLSGVDTDELFDNIAPDLIIADEAHTLANIQSTQTARVKRYMDENPETEFCALSGTMGKKHLKDYYHVLKWCLKERTPCPLTMADLDRWCEVLDTTFSEYTDLEFLNPLLVWAKTHFPDEIWKRGEIASYRKAYRYRLQTAAGVVVSSEAEVGTSLVIDNLAATEYETVEGWTELEKLFEQVELMKSPSGDEIEHPIHKFRYKYELTSGFYNKLIWPCVDKLQEVKGISPAEANELLDRSKEHNVFLQDYHKELRDWIKYNAKRGLDTPMQIGNDMYHHGDKNVGKSLYDAWTIPRKLEFEGMLERDSIPVRVCPFKINHAVEWALNIQKTKKSDEGVLVWYYNRCMGDWLYEAFQAAGIDCIYCPSGKVGAQRIIKEENKRKILIASSGSYYQGFNLQPVKHVLLTQFRREAHVMEQLLGRNHRTGSPYDELIVHTCNTLPFDHEMMSAVLADSLFQHQTGVRQKLIYATYTENPKILPSAVLTQRGIIQKEIDEKLEQALKDRFE